MGQVADDYSVGNPPPGQLDEDANPIGVPAGFKAKTQQEVRTNTEHPPPGSPNYGWFDPATRLATVEVTPRYNEGMEWEPGSWSPERVADLQSQMVDAGILDKSGYQRGFWDATSAAAYKKLLAYSNAAGLDYQATLSRYREVVAKYGKSEDTTRERTPFLGRRTDPERLNLLLDDVSVRLMGRGLTQDEKARFSNSFNEMEIAAQRQQYDQSGSGLPGGEGGITTDPDPQGQAEKFIRETRPQDIGAYNALTAFKAYDALLRSSMRK